MSNVITTDKYSELKKFGENFSITSKLADYILQPEWNEGYKAFARGDTYNDYSFLWQSVHAIGEELGAKIYSKIYNYIDNIKNIDTCEVQGLKNYAQLYGYKDSVLYNNYYFPQEISDLVDIFSVNKTFLTGSNTLSAFNRILSLLPAASIISLKGNDEDYIEYMKQVFYNTLKYFSNLQYRSTEVTYPDNTDNPKFTIWGTNIPKYSEKLFVDIAYTDYFMQQQKLKYGVPLSFNETKVAENILNGQDSINNYKATEQIIINLELDKLSNSATVKNKLDRYAYQRENKVLEYLQFLSVFSTERYTGITYDVDDSKLKITGPLNGISPIKYDTDNSIEDKYKIENYYLDYPMLLTVAEKLVDYCLALSYIRENMKTKAQKYYMAGSNKILVNIIREILFAQLYNLSNKSNYWRYLNNSNNFLDKNIKLLSNLNIETVEYLDPVEYFNINALSGDDLNLRYWENPDYYINDTLTTTDIVNFYKEIGLDPNLVQGYGPTIDNGALSSYWCLSSFLSVLFNSGASSATSANYVSGATSTYATTANRFVLGSNIDGVWYSDDNCKTQTHTEIIDKVYQCFSFGTLSTSSKIFVGGTINNGLWYSSDGITWTQSKITDKTWNCLYYLNNRFFAGSLNAGIWYSDNGIDWFNTSVVGGTWSGITSNGTRLVATSKNYEYGIYYSDDNGINWSKYTEITQTTILSGTEQVDVGNIYSPNYNYVQTAPTALTGYYTSPVTTGAVIQSVTTTGTYTSPIYMNFGGIAYGAGKFIAASYSTGTGIISSTDGITWGIANQNISGLTYNVTYGNNGFIVGTNDGIYYSTSGTTWALSQNTSGKSFPTTVYGNNLYLAGSNNNSGILSSTNPSSFSSTNITGNYWSSIGFGNPVFYTLSSGFEGTSGTYDIFTKYSGIPSIGQIPYANHKNLIHSSYQIHPYLYAFIQYNNAKSALNYLYSYYTPTNADAFDILLSRIDQYGNTIKFYLNSVIDFSGYNSAFEQDSSNNPLIGIDNPFNMDALNEYIRLGTNSITFSSNLSGFIEDYYPETLGLTDEMKAKITNQLFKCYFNIYDLRNYKIYKYCKDLNDNVYVLYKKDNSADTVGQLWIRYKNHPIAFPAFVFSYDNNLIEIDQSLSQITYSDLITLKNIALSVKQNTINIDGVNISILYPSPGNLYIYDIEDTYVDAGKSLILSGTYTNNSRSTGGSFQLSGVNIVGEYGPTSIEYNGGSLDIINASLSGTYNVNSINSITGLIDFNNLSISGILIDPVISTIGNLSNLILPSNGGVLSSYTSQYNANYAASKLTDGSNKNTGDTSTNKTWKNLNAITPQTFTYTFSGNQSVLLSSITLCTISKSKDFQIWITPELSAINWSNILTGTLPNNISAVSIPLSGQLAKAIQLRIMNSYATNMELAEFEVYGRFAQFNYNYNYNFNNMSVPYTYLNNSLIAAGINEIIYSDLKGENWYETNINDLNFTSICSAGPSLFYASSNKGIYTSTDSLSWTIKPNTTGIYFNDVTYNDGKVIGCSTSGIYVLSSSISDFVKTNITSGNFYKSLDIDVLSSGLYLDVATSDTGLYYSANSGLTWGLNKLGNYKDIVYANNALIAYSDDSVISGNLTSFTTAMTISGAYLNNLKYLNNKYLFTSNNLGIISSDLTNYIILSSPYTSANNSNYYTDIAWNNGSTYVAIGNKVGINYSTDLTSGFTFAINTSSTPISTLSFDEIVYDSGLSKFIAFSDTYALSSTNGVIWDTV